jgi:Spy/CpxP family protein refolding chaperone
MNWKKLTLIFICGIAVGFVAHGFIAHARFARMNPEKRVERMLNRLEKKLKLTPEQKEQVSSILNASRQKVDGLHNEVRPRFESIRSETDAQIRAVLTPDQQKGFDEMRAKWDARRKKNRPPWEKP